MLGQHKTRLRLRLGCVGLPMLPGEEVRGLSMGASGKRHRLKVVVNPDITPKLIFICRKCPVSLSVARPVLEALLTEKGTYLDWPRMADCRE